MSAEIAVAADWRLTYRTERSNFQNGTLKVILLHQAVLCAYAGDVDTALHAIREHGLIEADANPSDVVPELIEGLRRVSANGACDFIVASISPGAELVRIKTGEILRAGRAIQIGDPQAVEALLVAEQQVMARDAAYPLPQIDGVDAPTRDRIAAGRISDAVSQLVLTRDQMPTIGEHSISATTSRDGGFRYVASGISILTQDLVLSDDPEDAVRNEQRRMIDGGQFQVTVMTPVAQGIGALALHFPQYDLGIFTYPMRLGAQTVSYRGVDPSHLAERISAEHDVAFDSVFR